MNDVDVAKTRLFAAALTRFEEGKPVVAREIASEFEVGKDTAERLVARAKERALGRAEGRAEAAISEALVDATLGDGVVTIVPAKPGTGRVRKADRPELRDFIRGFMATGQPVDRIGAMAKFELKVSVVNRACEMEEAEQRARRELMAELEAAGRLK